MEHTHNFKMKYTYAWVYYTLNIVAWKHELYYTLNTVGLETHDGFFLYIET